MDFKIIIHVSHTSPVSCGKLAAHSEEIGAWGIGDIGPIFFKPANVNELVDHAANTAAHAPSIHYYYYHIPRYEWHPF